MRTIRFRGKDCEDGEWIYGDLIQRLGYYPTILSTYPTEEGKVGYAERAVKEETVGQITGLKDKDGHDIYEGDIVKCGSFVYQVVYDEKRFASFALQRKEDTFLHYFGEAMEASECVVIGNIHDNPELIRGE